MALSFPNRSMSFSLAGAAVKLMVCDDGKAFTGSCPLADAASELLSARPILELSMEADGQLMTVYLSPDAFLAALTASIQPC